MSDDNKYDPRWNEIIKGLAILDRNYEFLATQLKETRSEIKAEIKEFKTEYIQGKEAAREHAVIQDERDLQNVKRTEIPNLLSLEWLAQHKGWLIGILIILASLGYIKFASRSQIVIDAKQQLEDLTRPFPKGTKPR